VRTAATRDLARTEAGPLSWQQAFSLRREARLSVHSGNVATAFVVEDAESLPGRLAALVEREDALRIVGLPADGRGSAVYAETVRPPLEKVRVGALEELDAAVSEAERTLFARDEGPLWKMLVFEHPDEAGRRARTGLAVFDHQIADVRSSDLFRRELTRGPTGRPPGRYRAWVAWQLEQFPLEDAASVPTPAREFWRRYLDGTSPNRAPRLPFCDPDSRLTGLERQLHRELPFPAEGLRAAAARLRATPFVVFAGSVAAAIAQLTGEQDVTLRYASHGRFSPFLRTLGWLHTGIALRVRDPDLADPVRAVRAAMVSRLELIEFEMTPWGYVLEICGATGSEQPQVVVNFVPRGDPALLRKRHDDATEGGAEPDRELVPDLNLIVDVPRAGAVGLLSRFDPARFAAGGVEDFLQLVFRNAAQLAA
jgi:hypothetical protein